MQVPVLLNEVIGMLDPKPGERFIDATFGDGGHARVIGEKVGAAGMVLGIDWDPAQIAKYSVRSVKNILVIEENYANIKNIVRQHNFYPVDGILFDLGYSIFHIENSGKGFSFQRDEPLIMKYSEIGDGPTAKEIIHTWSEKELEEGIREYGEERFAGRIARAIVASRKRYPINTSGELARVVAAAVPHRSHLRIHPATKVFQALRIIVNDEFGNIKRGILGAVDILRPGGRIAVITFHSLEDRIVKRLFRELRESNTIELINKKVVTASRAEVIKNPRARSAKLRAAFRI